MEEIRLKKLQELREKGINPYPYRFEISDFIEIGRASCRERV